MNLLKLCCHIVSCAASSKSGSFLCKCFAFLSKLLKCTKVRGKEETEYVVRVGGGDYVSELLPPTGLLFILQVI
jgi:hypothetical protein